MKQRDFLLTRKKTPMLTTEQVKETKAFQGLTKTMQSIVRSYNNIKLISVGINIVKNKGFELFEKEHNYSWANLMIIKELTNE